MRIGRGPGTVAATLVAVALLLGACGSPSPSPPASGAASSPTAGGSATPAAGSADAIFTNANVVTMDDAHPSAQAVAVKHESIMAAGTNEEIAKLRGPATGVVDLGGLTLMPGFIDAHQHRIGDGTNVLGKEPKELIDAAIQQGYTTIDELYVDEYRLGVLRDLDTSGVLRLRVNAYFAVQENSANGTLFDPYYDAYQQGQVIGPHVRIAGLKVFTDFANATILLWKQADLNVFLLARHQKGWRLAIKTVSTKSLAMILEALESVRTADPKVVDARVRTEHTLFATADQIASMKALGVVPTINMNNPGNLLGTADQDQLLASNPAGSYTPWKSMFSEGLAPAGISGFPSGYVDEPTGAPFGSPIHLIYQGVTRAGNLGVQSPKSLLGEALTAEQSMRAMTINAAYAGWEDDVKGSISVGKLADLVVLSGDPLTVPAAQINDITVLMTMISGKVEWCATGSEAVCSVPGAGGGGGGGGTGTPAPSVAATPTEAAPADVGVTASASAPGAPPEAVIDGNRDTIWNAGAEAPQWIQLDFAQARTLAGLRLVVAQTPGGPTIHQVLIGTGGGGLKLAYEFKGTTSDGQELVWTPVTPLANVTTIQILTTASPSWVAWREIELIAP